MNALQYFYVAKLCLSLGVLVCFLTFVAQLFMHGETGWGIATLLMCGLCGIGTIFAFFFGWSKADEWDNAPLMLAWTLFFLLSLGANITWYLVVRSPGIL
jgi:hypothetical protein